MATGRIFICIFILPLVLAEDGYLAGVGKTLLKEFVAKGIRGLTFKQEDNSQESIKYENHLLSIREELETIVKGVDIYIIENKIDKLYTAGKEIDSGIIDLEQINKATSDESRFVFIEEFKNNQKRRNIMDHIDEVTQLFRESAPILKSMLDVLAQIFRCDIPKFEDFRSYHLNLLYKATALTIANIFYSYEKCRKGTGCGDVINAKLNQGIKDMETAHDQISKRIMDCHHDEVFVKHIGNDMKNTDNLQKLGENIEKRYPFLWVAIIKVNGDDALSFYIKPGSYVIKKNDAILVYGKKNESLSKNVLLDVQRVVRDALNESSCTDKKVFVQCHTEAVEKTITNNTGFVIRSLIGIFIENAQIDELFYSADTGAALVESENLKVEYCGSDLYPLCQINFFNIFGYHVTKEGTYRIFISVSKEK